jgi:glycosyltransferase involved in cell wall biosynthesis
MRIVRYYPRAAVGDGGMTGAVRHWSEALVRAGASVTIAYEEGGEPRGNGGVRWLPVRHARLGKPEVPLGFEEVLRDADLVVMHSGWALHNIRAGALARKMRVPYVLEPRGAYDPHIVSRKKLLKKAWWFAAERELVTSARAIHAFFESERAHLDAIGYRGRVVVASNGVVAPSGALWDGGSGGYVLWLGRFDPEHKGLDLLLAALQLLPPAERPTLRIHGPDWRGQRQKVRDMVSALGLDQWALVGESVHGEAKRNMLVKAQGFVYPSRWDACPNSVLEAVSYEVPTLATPYPLGVALAERGGAFLADATPAALAEGLRRLVSPEAAVVGRRGGQLLRDEFSWDQVAKSWLSQVEALL